MGESNGKFDEDVTSLPGRGRIRESTPKGRSLPRRVGSAVRTVRPVANGRIETNNALFDSVRSNNNQLSSGLLDILANGPYSGPYGGCHLEIAPRTGPYVADRPPSD